MTFIASPHTIKLIWVAMLTINALTIASSAYVITSMRRLRKRTAQMQNDCDALEARVRGAA